MQFLRRVVDHLITPAIVCLLIAFAPLLFSLSNLRQRYEWVVLTAVGVAIGVAVAAACIL